MNNKSIFAVRHILALVATIALALGLWSWMLRRSAFFKSVAERHMEAFVDHVAKDKDGDEKWQDYHIDMHYKYNWASRHPYFPVWADPSEPPNSDGFRPCLSY